MPKEPMSPKEFTLRTAAACAGSIVLLFVLLLAAYALPGGPVRHSVLRSVPLLEQEGLYPSYFNFKLFQMDNYTDTIMLFEAVTADEADPLTSMMTNTTYNVDNFESMQSDLRAYLEGDDSVELTSFSYARYWHGYLVWMRPLLFVGLTYGAIRWVNYAVLAVLFAVILRRLKKFCNLRVAVWFAVSQLAVSVFFVPRQMQYFTTFVIAYAGCVWVLHKHRPTEKMCIGLIVLGVCTSFFDLLVTPILTLALPMTVWLLLPVQRRRGGVPQCFAVVSGSLCWGVGYAVCWASKWVCAGIVTEQNIVGDAIHQMGVRTTADTWHGIELTWGNILRFVFATLSDHGLLIPAVLAVLAAAGLFCLCLRGKNQLLNALPLLLAALMAPVWLAVLRTHSIQHGWFTWRSLGATVFAGLGFLRAACSVEDGLARCRKLLGK